MSEQPPRKVKVLTRLKITEVSAVDRGAGENCRIVLSKRDDSDYDNVEPSHEERMKADLIGREALRAQERREKRDRDDDVARLRDIFLGKVAADEALGIEDTEKSFAADAAGDEADADEPDSPPEPEGASDNVVSAKHRPISFDTVDGVRMKFPNQRALAEWTAIQQRIRKSATPEEPTAMSLDLSAVVKQHGISALCRHFVKSQSSFGVDEHELVKLATEDAARRYPADTPAVAFSMLYTESDELRGAIELAKGAAFENAVTAEIEKDARAACEELTAIGKARWPSLSPSQRFARAFECNPELAKRAHRRPGPSTSFPQPVAKSPLVNVDSVTLTPQFVTETNVDSPEKALAQLKELGRQKWPSLSEAQSFLNAVTDPENAPLVRAALHRPTGSSPPRQ